jgi:hypothetical protein
LIVPPLAAQEIRTERVAFPASASGTVIEDSITGRESVSYGTEIGHKNTRFK